MVPYTSQSSRVHLTTAYVSILLTSFIFISVHATQSDNAFRMCSTENKNKNVTTENKNVTCASSFSNLTDYCTNNNISTLNLSGINMSSIVSIKLDFCSDSLPLVFFLSEFVNVTSTCNVSLLQPEAVSCERLKEIQQNDEIIKGYHGAFVDILQRSEFNFDKSSKNKTRKCEEAYKDWLCSSTRFAYKFPNEKESLKGCPSTAKQVCLHCPSFSPENAYGGFMAFQCKDETLDEDNKADPCCPKCVSSEKLEKFTTKITGERCP